MGRSLKFSLFHGYVFLHIKIVQQLCFSTKTLFSCSSFAYMLFLNKNVEDQPSLKPVQVFIIAAELCVCSHLEAEHSLFKARTPSDGKLLRFSCLLCSLLSLSLGLHFIFLLRCWIRLLFRVCPTESAVLMKLIKLKDPTRLHVYQTTVSCLVRQGEGGRTYLLYLNLFNIFNYHHHSSVIQVILTS